MKTYSIIIPHKNIPELLHRCLNSIPRRDDIEVLVVDDNSGEAYRRELQALAKSRPDVIFIYTKEGRGAGYARNVGLRKSTGKWLLFADADDYYSEGFIEVLDRYTDSEVDVVCFGSMIVFPDYKDSGQIDGWQPWNKMFRHDYICHRNLYFEEIPVGNDAMFVIQACFYASELVVEKSSLYNYVKRESSLNTQYSYDDETCRFELFLRMNRFFMSSGQKKSRINLHSRFAAMYKRDLRTFLLFSKLVFRYRQVGWCVYCVFRSTTLFRMFQVLYHLIK